MKHAFHLFVFLITTIRMCTLFACGSNHSRKDTKRFVVVSDASEAKQLYVRVKEANKGKMPYRPTTNVRTRRQICRDITNTYTFQLDQRDPYEKGLNVAVRRVKRFTYPYRIIPTVVDDSVERVFVCLAKIRWRHMRYYISHEYDLNAGTEESGHRAGRFVFRYLKKEWPPLYGLAELPAQTFASPDHDIEGLYLQRRTRFSVVQYAASTADRDALCRLPKNDVRRICVAVFNSKYFEGKIKLSNAHDVSGDCTLTNVSFQTEQGGTLARGRRFEQWMLSCEPHITFVSDEKVNLRLPKCCSSESMSREDEESEEEPFEYLLSHAYQSNEIFVYRIDRVTRRVFLENLTVRVRVTFDSRTHRKEYVLKLIRADDSNTSSYSIPLQKVNIDDD